MFEPKNVTSDKLKHYHELCEKMQPEDRSVIVSALRTAAAQYEADAVMMREDSVQMERAGNSVGSAGLRRLVNGFESQAEDARTLLWYLEL